MFSGLPPVSIMEAQDHITAVVNAYCSSDPTAEDYDLAVSVVRNAELWLESVRHDPVSWIQRGLLGSELTKLKQRLDAKKNIISRGAP